MPISNIESTVCLCRTHAWRRRCAMTMHTQGDTTMRWILVGIGIVIVLLSGLWFRQGVGILGGSVITRQRCWAIVGGILLIGGIALCVLGMLRRPTTPSR